MRSDEHEDAGIINPQALRMHVETHLQTRCSEESLAAIAHSLDCVLRQHLRGAWHGLKEEVADLLVKEEFEDIPVLEPRHFMPVVPDHD